MYSMFLHFVYCVLRSSFLCQRANLGSSTSTWCDVRTRLDDTNKGVDEVRTRFDSLIMFIMCGHSLT